MTAHPEFDDMKIWLFSDLHLEFADLRQPLAFPDADVCIVAGDLCRAPANGVHWLARHVAHAMPCVYVAGKARSRNHWKTGDQRLRVSLMLPVAGHDPDCITRIYARW